MPAVFNFERLEIWQKSRFLVKEVYLIISKFPKDEKYGLSDQLRRAVVSVASNIAEGTGRYSLREKIHFTEIAYGSLMEVMCQVLLSADLELTELDNVDEIRQIVYELAKQMSSYRNSLIKQMNSK